VETVTKPKDVNAAHMDGTLDPDNTVPLEPPPDGNCLTDKWRPMPHEWISEKPPQRRYLLSINDPQKHSTTLGVLPQGRVGLLVAAGGVGKSWALIQLAVAVATGRQWFGTFDVEGGPGRVLLLMGEEESEEMRRRLYWALKALNLGDEKKALVTANLFPLALHGEQVALLGDDGVENKFAVALRSKLNGDGKGWRLIILDPASRFAHVDAEKDNAHATRFVQALESLTAAPGNPTVLCAHHTNKASRTSATDSTAARGVSGLTDAARWVANLDALPHPDKTPGKWSDQALFKVVKTNYGAYPEPVYLTRDIDHDGLLRQATKEERQAYKEAEEKAAEDDQRKKNEVKQRARETAESKTNAKKPPPTTEADIEKDLE
jgi:hypothetical protein